MVMPGMAMALVYQELGHACAVTYYKQRHMLPVLAVGMRTVIVVWPHDHGLTREIDIARLGER